jgi:hypothetical protein
MVWSGQISEIKWQFIPDVLLLADELQFVTDGQILFTPESEPSEDNTLTSCVFVAAVDNNLIEPEEVATLMIDPNSLMSKDTAIDPRMVELLINNNDGMYVHA